MTPTGAVSSACRRSKQPSTESRLHIYGRSSRRHQVDVTPPIFRLPLLPYVASVSVARQRVEQTIGGTIDKNIAIVSDELRAPHQISFSWDRFTCYVTHWRNYCCHSWSMRLLCSFIYANIKWRLVITVWCRRLSKLESYCRIPLTTRLHWMRTLNRMNHLWLSDELLL